MLLPVRLPAAAVTSVLPGYIATPPGCKTTDNDEDDDGGDLGLVRPTRSAAWAFCLSCSFSELFFAFKFSFLPTFDFSVGFCFDVQPTDAQLCIFPLPSLPSLSFIALDAAFGCV